MLIAFFKISRCRLRYSTSLCNCRIVCAICSGLCCCPSICTGCCRFKYAFFHPCRLASLHPSSRAICTKLLPPGITIYTALLLYFLLPSGPLSFFEFPCPSNRGRFKDVIAGTTDRPDLRQELLAGLLYD